MLLSLLLLWLDKLHDEFEIFDTIIVIIVLYIVVIQINYTMSLCRRYGNWGICFMYGTSFALRALAAVGKTYNNCSAIRKAVVFYLEQKKMMVVGQRAIFHDLIAI